MSQKFCNIFICANTQHIYQMTKSVQPVEGMHCGSWLAIDTLCIVSFHVRFGSHTDECAT